MRGYSHIIWDWNGTLLDDTAWCVQVENGILASRGLPTLTVEDYRRHFTFPVIRYYSAIGFTFETETFEEVSEEFVRLYHDGDAENCRLHRHAEDILRALSGQGFKQAILSASETGNLISQVSRYGINSYFDRIVGIGDVFAAGKIEAGRAYLSEAKVEKALLIGDTLHDYEVAEALGADCVLIANGHQNRETLLTSGTPVLEDISMIPAFLAGAALKKTSVF